MSWPIGTLLVPEPVAIAADGAIMLGGVRVTDADGWIDVSVHPDGRGLDPSASMVLHLRLRVELNEGGLPFVYANEVATRGRRFASVLAAIASGCDSWASALPTAVLQELTARHRRMSRSQSAVHRIVSTTAERDDAAPKSPYRRRA